MLVLRIGIMTVIKQIGQTERNTLHKQVLYQLVTIICGLPMFPFQTAKISTIRLF